MPQHLLKNRTEADVEDKKRRLRTEYRSKE
jgi:hypothetical protein